MKKTIFVVALSIAGFIAVWRFEPTPLGSTAVAQPPSQTTTAPSTAEPPTSSGESGSGATTTPPSTSDRSSTSTVVTQGSAESSQYGTVQVQVAFSGTKITEIRLLQAPTSGRGVGALPQLQQEALQAQSANIDTVSGATETSESYKTSLQAAIDRRGA